MFRPRNFTLRMAQSEFSVRSALVAGLVPGSVIIPQEGYGSRLTGSTGGAVVTWAPTPLIKSNGVEAGILILGESELRSVKK